MPIYREAVYREAVKLAKEYALSARLAFTKQGAAEAWDIAKKYQDAAAKLDGGRKPDIGPLPSLLTQKRLALQHRITGR